MGRPELGIKCTCAQCHERFYDLNRSPAMCPKCGAQQPPEKPRVSRPLRGGAGFGMQPRRSPVAVTTDDEVEAVAAPEAEEAEAEEAEAEDGAPVLDEDADDEIEIEPDRAQTPD